MVNQIQYAFEQSDLGSEFINGLKNMIDNFLQNNFLAKKAFEVALKNESKPVVLDHTVIRTFKIDGLGIDSVAPFFLNKGYTYAGVLDLPDQIATPYWFRPPKGYEDLLPRVFIAEIDISTLSEQVQNIIKKYTSPITPLTYQQTIKSSGSGKLLWQTPSIEDYEILNSESKLVSWNIAHGYALNHVTLSVHNIQSLENGGIQKLKGMFDEAGIELNQHGGAVKVTQDGGLLQIATVNDQIDYTFKCGNNKKIPFGFLECAERLVLKEFEHLRAEEIREIHRRDGFEETAARQIYATIFQPAKDAPQISED